MMLEGAPKPAGFAAASPNPSICPKTTPSAAAFAGDAGGQSPGLPSCPSSGTCSWQLLEQRWQEQ